MNNERTEVEKMTYVLIICAIILFIIGFVCINKIIDHDPKVKYLVTTLVCWLASMICITIAIIGISETRYNSNTSDANCSCECSCCQTCTDCNSDETG